MGLDATVMCNCYRDGKTTEPPFPRSWIELDEDGYYSLKREYDCNENIYKFWEWEQDCCEHPQMEFADERIGNWSSVRLFQSALEDAGRERLPVLADALPNANGGCVSPGDSAKALLELQQFIGLGALGTKTVLVDSSTGEAFREHVPAYEGIFIMSGSQEINVGVGEFEFFAVDTESGAELFRASRVRQYNRDGSKVAGHSNDVVWEDLDGGAIFQSGIAVSGKQIPWEDGAWQNQEGKCRWEYPVEFHVEQRPKLAEEYDYIVKVLSVVFSASVETGNPVRWC